MIDMSCRAHRGGQGRLGLLQASKQTKGEGDSSWYVADTTHVLLSYSSGTTYCDMMSHITTSPEVILQHVVGVVVV